MIHFPMIQFKFKVTIMFQFEMISVIQIWFFLFAKNSYPFGKISLIRQKEICQ